MRCFVLSLISLLAFPVTAQVPDPTRPADVPPAVSAGGGSGAGGLQAIVIRRGGRSSAVIDGEEVYVGERIGNKITGRRVLKISENAVVVQGEGGRETIRLIAAVEKMPASGPRTMNRKASPRGKTGTSEQ
jgi:hypothetical protein